MKTDLCIALAFIALIVSSVAVHAQPIPGTPVRPGGTLQQGVASTTMPPQGAASIGYADPKSALEALEKMPQVKITVRADSWTIAEDKAAKAIWSFPPSDHPAYPAVVKRTFVETRDTVFIDMKAICQAQKADCDKLMADFQDENSRLRASYERQAKEKK